jgi:hypothetical protein
VPTCAGRECGDDGCGGSCGSCEAGFLCQNGYCACVTDVHAVCCASSVCWADSCADVSVVVAECPYGCEGATCLPCVPSCDGRACGDDGCDGSCGVCPQGLDCEEGACVGSPEADPSGSEPSSGELSPEVVGEPSPEVVGELGAETSPEGEEDREPESMGEPAGSEARPEPVEEVHAEGTSVDAEVVGAEVVTDLRGEGDPAPEPDDGTSGGSSCTLGARSAPGSAWALLFASAVFLRAIRRRRSA